jgi:hypothetical protein
MQPPQEQEPQQLQQRGEGQQVLYGGQMLSYEDALDMKRRDGRMYGPQYVDTMERMSPASFFRGGAASPPAGEGVGRSASGKKWFWCSDVEWIVGELRVAVRDNQNGVETAVLDNLDS